LYHDISVYDDNLTMPPEISFRLTALRETFEETGLLIATEGTGGVPVVIQDENSTVGNKALKDWRLDIQKDPSKVMYFRLWH